MNQNTRGYSAIPTDAIILNWHDARRTKACLDSLGQDGTLDRVYIVDNESDGSLDIREAEYPFTVTVLRVRENRGFSGGVNVAIRRRRLDDRVAMLLVLNNDAELRPGAVKALRDALITTPEYGLVSPVILNTDGSIQARGARVSKVSGIARSNTTLKQRLDYLTWACVMLHPTALDEIGDLSEEFFMYWEDADYGRRARLAGFKPAVIEGAEIVHELSGSSSRAGSVLREYYAWGLRVYGLRAGKMAQTRSLLGYLILLAARLRVGDRDGATALMRGWARGRRYPTHQCWAGVAP